MTFCVAFTVLTLSFSVAQEKQPSVKVDPATLKHPVYACLFKVEGNGLKKPCWLFGTIHLGPKNVSTLHPRAEEAFAAADAVYTEIDLDPASQLAVAPLMMRKDGQTLTEALGPELAEKVQAALSDINPALKVSAFNPLKTWVMAITLPILELQLKNQQSLDTLLYQRAQKEGKTVGALETAASQVAVFDQFSEEDIQSMLVDTLKTMKEDKLAEETSIVRLLNTYLTGDVYQIGKFVKDEMAKENSNEEFSKRLMKALLDDRNIGMADMAEKIMQEHPERSSFFAVGAAHYTGKTAVQDLLKEKGYQITEAFK